MSRFSELFEYNRWANNLVLDAASQMGPEALAAPMPELGRATIGLLEHLAQVQANFLGIMTGAGRPTREEGRTFEQITALLRLTDEGFLAALPALEARFRIALSCPGSVEHSPSSRDSRRWQLTQCNTALASALGSPVQA